MNRIILSGNLTKTPELKFYQNTTVAKFGKTAELCAKYLEKGRRVIIEGRLQTSGYTDKDGNKRTSYDVIVENLEFADSKKKADSPPTKDDNNFDMPF